MNVNGKIWDFLDRADKEGWGVVSLRGARRSGKTYTIMQYGLNTLFDDGAIFSVASMTAEQSRKGAYADAKTIIRSNPSWLPYYTIHSAPREILCNINRGERYGEMQFASYQDPETAKGIACDYAFLNEANKFTLQQYIDLSANVRKLAILDFNPMNRFWVDDVVPPEHELKVTYKDNIKHLTQKQIEWFEQLEYNAHRNGATQMDIYLYMVYCLGEYCELIGSIFTPNNIRICKRADLPATFDRVVVFSDPSARMGADYHATVMAGLSIANKKIYILDTDSRNIGTDYEMVMLLKEWTPRYDRIAPYIETNGAIGEQFYQYCRKSNIAAIPFNSKANKIDRILSNYQTICESVEFVDSDHLLPFLEQIYTFDGYEKKCEHDDNIDAVNSAVTILKPYLR